MSFHVQRNIRSGKEVFLFSYLSIPFLLRMPISVIKSSLSPPSKCLVYPPLPLYLLCYCPSQAFVFSFAKNFILFITGVLAFVPCPLLVPSPYPSILTSKIYLLDHWGDHFFVHVWWCHFHAQDPSVVSHCLKDTFSTPLSGTQDPSWFERWLSCGLYRERMPGFKASAQLWDLELVT